MANYDSNFQTMMGGHLFGDDSRIKVSTQNRSRVPADDTADIRDILTDVVGNSYKGLTDDNIKAQYARLSNLVGVTQAQKLLDHALIYNQNPVNVKLPLEQRVQGFYSAGSKDQSLNTIIQNAGKLGYGPVASLNNSANVGNRILSGTYNDAPIVDNSEVIQLANKKLK